jgi:hypothetical protein
MSHPCGNITGFVGFVEPVDHPDQRGGQMF